MEKEYLQSLCKVLDDMAHSKQRSYQKQEIEEIAPLYAKAIFCYLKENEVVTITTMGMIIKPNGKLESLLQECKAKLAEIQKAEKDHAFARFKDWTSLVISGLALVVSIIALLRTCSF